MLALEDNKRVVELLNAYIDARQESVEGWFPVWRNRLPEMAGLVLIAASGAGGRRAGGRLG